MFRTAVDVICIGFSSSVLQPRYDTRISAVDMPGIAFEMKGHLYKASVISFGACRRNIRRL